MTEWLEADGLGGFASGTGPARARGVTTRCCWPRPAADGRALVLVNGVEAWLETPDGAGRAAATALRARRRRTRRRPPVARFTRTSRGRPGRYALARRHARRGRAVRAARQRRAVALRWRRLRRARARPVTLRVRRCCRGRDYHALHHENPAFRFDARARGRALRWRPYAGVPASCVAATARYAARAATGTALPLHRGAARGLDCDRGLGVARRARRSTRRPASRAGARRPRPRRGGAVERRGRRSRSRGASARRAPRSRRRLAARRRRLHRRARRRQDDHRRLPLVHRLGPRHVHRAARAVPGDRPLDDARAILLRLGGRGVGGHAAEPLPRQRRRRPSTTRSTPRSGTWSPCTTTSDGGRAARSAARRRNARAAVERDPRGLRGAARATASAPTPTDCSPPASRACS